MPVALRPYQVRDVEQLIAAYNGRRAVLYVLPTGGGKTIVFTHFLERCARSGRRAGGADASARTVGNLLPPESVG
jgi:superfamily II DNA or RNA helicase